MPVMEGSYHKGLKLGTGVWTPWAEVLCARCLEAKGLESKVNLPVVAVVRERRSDYWELQGWCTSCGDQVWVDNKVANEQRMVNALVNHGIPAKLQQTGGMCSAVEAWAPDDKTYIMVTADEESKEDYGGDGWTVAVYNDEGEWLGFEAEPLLNFDDAVNRAIALYTSISHVSHCGGAALDESQI